MFELIRERNAARRAGGFIRRSSSKIATEIDDNERLLIDAVADR